MPVGVYKRKPTTKEFCETMHKTALKYGFGKWMKGKKLSVEHIKNRSISQSGKNSGLWKGDKVGYFSLHAWVRKYKPKVDSCEFCGLVKKLDLANKNGTYDRNFDSYLWLCHSCHFKYDNKRKKPITLKMINHLMSDYNLPKVQKFDTFMRRVQLLIIRKHFDWNKIDRTELAESFGIRKTIFYKDFRKLEECEIAFNNPEWHEKLKRMQDE